MSAYITFKTPLILASSFYGFPIIASDTINAIPLLKGLYLLSSELHCLEELCVCRAALENAATMNNNCNEDPICLLRPFPGCTQYEKWFQLIAQRTYLCAPSMNLWVWYFNWAIRWKNENVHDTKKRVTGPKYWKDMLLSCCLSEVVKVVIKLE